jgi:hypothetical protein
MSARVTNSFKKGKIFFKRSVTSFCRHDTAQMHQFSQEQQNYRRFPGAMQAFSIRALRSGKKGV